MVKSTHFIIPLKVGIQQIWVILKRFALPKSDCDVGGDFPVVKAAECHPRDPGSIPDRTNRIFQRHLGVSQMCTG